MSHGVIEQVAHEAAELLAVAADLDLPGRCAKHVHLDGSLPHTRLESLECIRDQSGGDTGSELHRLTRHAGAAECEHLLGEMNGAFEPDEHATQRRIALGGRAGACRILRMDLERRERRAQLVGRVGRKAPLAGERSCTRPSRPFSASRTGAISTGVRESVSRVTEPGWRASI